MNSTVKRTALSRLLTGAWVTVLLIAASTGLRSAPGDEAFKPRPGPAWELKDLDGKTVKSTDFDGKVVILDFWATWCPPCRAEIPSFIALQKQYGDKGLVVVGVSLDQGGPTPVKNFMAKMGVNYPVVLSDQKTLDAFGGIESIPTTFIIDRKGRIVRRHIGLTDKEEFEKDIKPLLAK